MLPLVRISGGRSDDGDTDVSDHNVDAFDLGPGRPFDASSLEALSQVATALHIDEPPLAHLVWENSD